MTKQCDRLFTGGGVNWTQETGVRVITVYMDLVCLLNFLVDLLLLLGTNRLAGFPPGLGRAVSAALLGGLYASVCLLPGFCFLGGTFWRMIFLGLMGVTAFGVSLSACRRTGIFLLLAMAMGGIAVGLEKIGFQMLLLSAAGIWLLSHVGFGGTLGGREYIPIAVSEGEKTVSVIALKDTGNTLRDPVTGEQVLILGPEAAQRLLELTPEQLAHPLDTMMTEPEKGLRLIPYSTVGNPGGMLLARRFRNVRAGGRQMQALVAFAPEQIGKAEVYQALAGGMI